MMLLIALAVGVAYLASLATTFGLLDLDFWWELGALVTIMLLGHWQEMRAVGQATDALESLSELLPDDAERVMSDGEIEVVPVSELVTGDVVLVRPGSAVPADGEVVEGEADVDESMLTGETTPVARGVGDRLAAGSVVAGSALRVQVAATGEDTALAGIRRMVADAQESTGRAQRLADRAAALLFYVATGAALATAAVWLALGEPGQAVTRAVTVLVISCPHALGLAIPLVVSISTSKSARAGMLVRDRLALERLRDVDIVLFDKTGTLTKGAHRVADVAADDPDEAVRLAAAVERDSEHPLARAIVTAAEDRGITIPDADEFSSLAGRGVRATVDGRDVAVGGPQLLEHLDLTPSASMDDATQPWRDRGAAVLHLVVDGEVVAAFGLEDEVRPEAAQAVADLHAAGVEVAMLTGDARNVAEAVAADLDIDRVRAQVLPQDKQDEVRALQADGRVVAMVGDGVNDAPALALADVGIAIGAGTDVAAASAHVILASDDPRGVVSLRRLSAASYRKMRQNLVWAAGYNVLAIPLAAGVLAPVGILLPPAIGAVLMSLSTIIVALNAQLLRRVDLTPGGA